MGIKIMPLLSAVFIMVSFIPRGFCPVFADSFAEAEIPVTCVTAVNVPEDKRDFTYTLTAAANDQPMPEGSDGKTKTVHMKGSGNVKFGSIRFDHPESYTYVIRETTKEWSKFKRDRTVYKAEVTADTDGEIHIVINNGRGEKVDKAEFVNSYYLGKDYASPKMGDAAKIAEYILLALTGALLLLILYISHKKSGSNRTGRCRQMVKKVRKSMSMLLAFAICFTAGAAFVFADIDIETFNPRTGRYVYLIKSNLETFQSQGGDLVESVNSTSDGALIPADPDYRHMIRNVYDSDLEESKPYTEMIDGIAADDKYIDELTEYSVAAYKDTKVSGEYKYPVNRSHFWWFKMSTETGKRLSGFKAPKVKWTGLYIYDKEIDGYQEIDLYMEVVSHSMAGNFSNHVPALFSVSKGVNGLPSVRLYHIKAVQLRFTAKIAGTDEIYPIKTSITFGDIDGRQSVSAAVSSTSGFASKDSGNILFGPYGSSPDQYWAATGNTDNNISGDSVEADNYKIAFYLNGGGESDGNIDLVFTSSQQDNNKPTGNFARFSASTYQNPDKAPDSPEIHKPVKYASDSNFDDDEDKGTVKINGLDSPARTHNTLADYDEITTYTIIEKVPPLMYSTVEEADLSEFSFSDEIDSCLDYVPDSIHIYSAVDNADVDRNLIDDPVSLDLFSSNEITDKFDISYDSETNTLTSAWKSGNSGDERDNLLYGNSDGAVIKFVFDVKIKDDISSDELASHVGQDGKPHGNGSEDIDIPNQAVIRYRFRNETKETELASVNARYDESGSDDDINKNSFVYTSIKPVEEADQDEIDKEDIIISKNVTGSLGDITKKFEFVFKLKNADEDCSYSAVKGSESYTVTTDQDGNASFSFTLKDDEEIIIKDIPESGADGEPTSYSVIEKPSDHIASYTADTGEESGNSSPWEELKTSSLDVSDTHKVTFTNERNAVPVTGVKTEYRPYIVIFLLLILAGTCTLVRIK